MCTFDGLARGQGPVFAGQCFGLADEDQGDKPTRAGAPNFRVPEGVAFHTADIMSEGTIAWFDQHLKG